jgi:hypothetical protein
LFFFLFVFLEEPDCLQYLYGAQELFIENPLTLEEIHFLRLNRLGKENVLSSLLLMHFLEDFL